MKVKPSNSFKLSSQVLVYSLDTSAFYTDEEQLLNQAIYRIRQVNNEASKQAHSLSAEALKTERKKFNRQIKDAKVALQEQFERHPGLRSLREDAIQTHPIRMFESSLTRIFGIQPEALTLDLMIVRRFYARPFKDLILNGFIFRGEKYCIYTASAGQIRTKKVVFVRESLFLKHKDRLMCGLSIDKINQQGGSNTNKFMAYTALSNSASIKWDGFNINRVIVVDDLTTNIHTEVDYIHNRTFAIERKEMTIPIVHTDGCGMMLPSVSSKSMMIRMPWIKGLLVPFAFDQWLEEKGGSAEVTDIYGKKWNVLQDRISIILTKSQFKMHAYYRDWTEYRRLFSKHKCEASICGMEDEYFQDAKLNYQMLQSLNQMTESELETICRRTIDHIHKIGRDKGVMLRVLGVTKSNTNKNYFQQALEVYPELLADDYSKYTLKQVKKSLIKRGREGKLEIDGKYTYLVPDLYAFAEKLFAGVENPRGLLNNGEVYCRLYANGTKLDCLRSPHLYREHAIRVNAEDEEKRKWFMTKGLYTSIHDAISLELQFDNDGDKSLVAAEQALVECAERHMQDDRIVPLYYEMAAADKEMISNLSIYNGLEAAFKVNIGEVSNTISKIWNRDVDNQALEAIKLLVFKNNETIDYAKTLHLSEMPESKQRLIGMYARGKLPHFFRYAKDKKAENVEPINHSTVNRLQTLIQGKRIYFADVIDKFDYRVLMNNPAYIVNQAQEEAVIRKYEELDLRKWYMNISLDPDARRKSNDGLYAYQLIRDQLLSINDNIFELVDILVKHLYSKKKTDYKTTLWSSFGDVIVRNLKNNLGMLKVCRGCGDLFEGASNKIICVPCAAQRQKDAKKRYKTRVKRTGDKVKIGQGDEFP